MLKAMELLASWKKEEPGEFADCQCRGAGGAAYLCTTCSSMLEQALDRTDPTRLDGRRLLRPRRPRAA